MEVFAGWGGLVCSSTDVQQGLGLLSVKLFFVFGGRAFCETV